MRKLICMSLLLLPASATAQVPVPVEQHRTMTVNGIGIVEREPEQGVVVLAVESEAQTAQAAATANAQRMTQLNAALRRAGVPERSIRTLSYELRPEYAHDERGRQAPRIVAYRAINMVQVTVDDATRLGSIIDTGIGNGANRVANIRLQLRDPQAAHNEALAIAMRNAHAQAVALAEAAGERLGPPMAIHTSGYMPVPPPMPRAYAGAEMMAMDAATPIEGGTLMVQASVHAVYRLLDR